MISTNKIRATNHEVPQTDRKSREHIEEQFVYLMISNGTDRIQPWQIE